VEISGRAIKSAMHVNEDSIICQQIRNSAILSTDGKKHEQLKIFENVRVLFGQWKISLARSNQHCK